MHHVLGIGSMVACMIAGYGLVGLNTLVTLTELSTIFLNYRSLMHVHEYNNFWPTVNAIVFFLTYTVFRMALLPFFVTSLYTNLTLSWDYISTIRKVCMVTGITLYSFTIVLIVFWYYKIIISLAKLCGCIKVKPRKKEI